MRPLFGKRFGQSDQELVPALFFSFVLHVLVFFIALLLYGRAVPKIHVPPFYQVTIVDQALDLPEDLPQAPLAPAEEPKPPAKTLKPEPAPKKELRKDAMPEQAAETGNREATGRRDGQPGCAGAETAGC